MGPVNAVYNWGSVKALYATVSSMNLAGLIAVILAIVWAVRFGRGFGDYLNLVSPGDGYVWMSVIISSAVLCSPAYILGLKSCLSLRMESSKADLEEEQKIDDLQRVANRLLFFHVIACLLSGFLVAVLNATYLALLSGFQQKSRDGLMQAIQKYGSDVTVKERVDAVQTEFECCGDSGYEDWFRVPWLKLAIEGPEHHENGPRLEEQWVYSDSHYCLSSPDDQDEEPLNTADVPFSCCSNDIPKPCVHHDILNPSAAYDYNPKHLTIATLGCRPKIIDRAATVRIFLSGYLAVLTIYQVESLRSFLRIQSSLA
ncbi:photoreceptor outer segment membrane glycoprotein 2 [Lasioglossum baleicum]|uniref:photoreceptor outer segment membrane glycoprotein 2 n=1 Tax=Lasioglossum baleicum TaxID=434251 RepID=UPI003FCECFF3